MSRKFLNNKIENYVKFAQKIVKQNFVSYKKVLKELYLYNFLYKITFYINIFFHKILP